jgi:hypothetical protein
VTFLYWAERLRSDSRHPDSLLLLAGWQSSCFQAAGLERGGEATGFWCYSAPIMKWRQTVVDEMSRCCRIDRRVSAPPATDLPSLIDPEDSVRVAMITGDSKRVADSVAGRLGIDEVAAQVLPADKASAVVQFQAGGNKSGNGGRWRERCASAGHGGRWNCNWRRHRRCGGICRYRSTGRGLLPKALCGEDPSLCHCSVTTNSPGLPRLISVAS